MSQRLWKFLTSLKVTVVLLLLATLLVFLGTLAQVHEGLWEAQERWFKSYLVFRREGDVWWVPPIFPGGYTIGFSMLISLLAAHIHRFQFGWKKVGIHLTHAGVALLLVGQLVTDMLSRESFMRFVEGETRSYSEAHRDVELVAIGEPDKDGRERVISFTGKAVSRRMPLQNAELPFEIKVLEYAENSQVLSLSSVREVAAQLTTALATLEAKYATPEGLAPEAERALENEGRAAVWQEALKTVGESGKDIVAAARRIAADPAREGKLRAELKVRFREQMLGAFQRVPPMQMANERMRSMKYVGGELAAGRTINPDALQPASTHGAGQRVLLLPLAPVRGMDEQNVPSAKVELFAKGASLGVWAVSPELTLQEVQVDGRTFKIGFRNERYYQPFSLTLVKTTHEVYPGTEIPKNFQSRVLLENKEKGEKREADISMNNPLRYGGLTFYQHQMGRTEATGGKGTSALQVVRNPGWITPYLGCAIVSLGMAWQFLYHLVGFLSKPRVPKGNSVPAKA
ncbi:MAG: cytochrome c biogenesis protein ResB [Verrucomicrobiota bacterium]